MPGTLADDVRALAVCAFKANRLRRHGALDFLLAGDSGVLYLNELNTIPGFTTISMYSKMWAASGVTYPQLLDRLIQLAIDRRRETALASQHVSIGICDAARRPHLRNMLTS